ncbi:copper transporter [Calditerricola satsumensis]|uniref:Copper transporter n=1 Tax=Calditerricola satsumensis TaxID=373054 RepID=A0A8J3FBD0_9BACI|nr:copper transporter [Calditerricola satsumensis]GGK01296.1 hypothetical protein GCM10007043_14190 [Calditerricola satsumensis]
MYPWRYHVVTVSSVFLALGVGILLGGTAGQRWIEANQQDVIASLAAKYDETVRQNKALQRRLDELHVQFEETVREMSRLVLAEAMAQASPHVWLVGDPEAVKGLADFLRDVGFAVTLVPPEAQGPPEKPEAATVLVVTGDLSPAWAGRMMLPTVRVDTTDPTPYSYLTAVKAIVSRMQGGGPS